MARFETLPSWGREVCKLLVTGMNGKVIARGLVDVGSPSVDLVQAHRIHEVSHDDHPRLAVVTCSARRGLLMRHASAE